MQVGYRRRVGDGAKRKKKKKRKKDGGREVSKVREMSSFPDDSIFDRSNSVRENHKGRVAHVYVRGESTRGGLLSLLERVSVRSARDSQVKESGMQQPATMNVQRHWDQKGFVKKKEKKEKKEKERKSSRAALFLSARDLLYRLFFSLSLEL